MRVKHEEDELKQLRVLFSELRSKFTGSPETRFREEDEILMNQLARLPFDFSYVYNFRNNKIAHARGIFEALGYEENDLTPDRVYDLTHPQDLGSLIKVEKKMISCALTLRNNSAKKANLFMSYRLRNKNGNYIKVNRQSAFFQEDENGRPLSMLHLFTNVSDLIQDDEVSYALDFPGHRDDLKQNHKELPITPRELEILRMISKGKSSNDIGKELYISPETVNKHRKNMIRKTGMQDTYRLALRAIQENWL